MKYNIHWFREDLRVNDNPALFEAAKIPVIPIYILNTNNSHRKLGEASSVWLHHSLSSLNKTLNNNLKFFIGDPFEILSQIINEKNIDTIYWNHIYDPSHLAEDAQIKKIKNHSKY